VALFEQIDSDLRQARLDRDQQALGALGMLKAEIVNASKEPGAGAVDDQLVIRTVRREVKKREEAAELYRRGGRPGAADKEVAEAEVIRRYLPAEMDDEELESELRAVIAELGAQGPQAFGPVMKAATARLGERAQGGRLAAAARRLLNA
jgi:uncharacterized protein YqeY